MIFRKRLRSLLPLALNSDNTGCFSNIDFRTLAEACDEFYDTLIIWNDSQHTCSREGRFRWLIGDTQSKTLDPVDATCQSLVLRACWLSSRLRERQAQSLAVHGVDESLRDSFAHENAKRSQDGDTRRKLSRGSVQPPATRR